MRLPYLLTLPGHGFYWLQFVPRRRACEFALRRMVDPTTLVRGPDPRAGDRRRASRRHHSTTDLDHVLLEATYADGGAEQYQVFVAWDLPTAGGVRRGRDDRHDRRSDRVGRALRRGRDPAHRRPDRGRRTDRGPLRFRPEPDVELELADAPRVSEAEQSNTSVLFGSEVILKVFRRLVPGINPDVELSQVLARHGSRHVPGDATARSTARSRTARRCHWPP